MQCLARLERRHRKTLTLGRDPGKAVSSTEAPVVSGDSGIPTLHHTKERPLRWTVRSVGKGRRETRSWVAAEADAAPFPSAPALPRPAVTGVPTGWDSDHGRVPTFAEAPCGDHVTDGFLAATPRSLRTLVPAPRAPALRLRRRLPLTACPRHDVTPSKGLKLQLATGRSGVGVGGIPKRGTKLWSSTAQAFDLSHESLWLL